MSVLLAVQVIAKAANHPTAQAPKATNLRRGQNEGNEAHERLREELWRDANVSSSQLRSISPTASFS